MKDSKTKPAELVAKALNGVFNIMFHCVSAKSTKKFGKIQKD